MVDIHAILALTDFSAQGDRAVLRAAALAQQRGCLLKIMYAPSDLQGAVDADAAQGVKRLASGIHARFGILVKQVADTSGHFESVVEEARWVDLLVIGHAPQGSTSPFVGRQAVERLRRIVSCPILVARLDASHRYQRVLVATDAVPRAGTLLKVARSLERDAEVEPLGALDARLDAERRARAAPSSHSIAELIVVGRRRRCAISDFFFGGLAHRVLRRSTGDVLLVPHNLRIEPAPGPAMTSDASPVALRPQTLRG